MNEKICSDLGVAILAGGSSRRFGEDKAQFRIRPDGPTLLESVLHVARKLTHEVVIIGHERYFPLAHGIPILREDSPGNGPLPAIEAALANSSAPRILVLACDMPCLSVPLLTWMANLQTGADAVVPQTLDGRWHPLHAIYRTTCLPAIRTSREKGNNSASSFYGEVSIEILTKPIMRKLDAPLNSLFSLNTPEDLPAARLCASSR